MSIENKQLVMSIDGISLYAVYANACLGLRHPGNKGDSRRIAKDAIRIIGRYLVDNQIITNAVRIEHEKFL